VPHRNENFESAEPCSPSNHEIVLHELKRSSHGPTLVFLHGFLGNAFDWHEVAALLPFSSFALDLPGHNNAPFTPDFCTAILNATQRFEPLNLIGYSMGGRLALQFAAKHPDKIGSLTLLSAHLGLKTGHKHRLEKDLALAQQLVTLSIDEFLNIWYDQPIFKTLVAKMDIRSMRREQNKENLSLALSTFSLGHQPDRSTLLASVPARLLVGELDDAYRAHYKDFPHTLIPDAGHAAHLENPQAVAGAIYDSFS
jgi:2-succinyl-6-hydroxy-2,4-cyclohexadiene-1-carboxylate synthase